MLAKNQFKTMLTDLVQPNTPTTLRWRSESDFAVEVVELSDLMVFNWVPDLLPKPGGGKSEVFAKPISHLFAQRDYTEAARAAQLAGLINAFTHLNDNSRVFYRRLPEPGRWDVYLLVRYDELPHLTWVGLKCPVVQT